MKYVGLTLGVLLVAIVLYVATRKSLSIDQELAQLVPGDRQALEALLADSGLSPTQLRAVEPGAVKYNAKSLAVVAGRVVALRLSAVPLPRADAVVKLTGLQELWLSENGLSALPALAPLSALQRLDLSGNQLRELGPLSGLPVLQRLRLGHNAVQSVAGLRNLPALTELDLTANQVSDLNPLTALPVLTVVDATHNPITAAPNPTPTRWTVKLDPQSAPAGKPVAGRPSNWVAKLPPTGGETKQGSTIDGYVHTSSYKVTGAIPSLRGTVELMNIPSDASSGGGGVQANLELEVEKGRVRAYLQYVEESDSLIEKLDGYVFAEAEPGKPGKIKGILPGGIGGQKVFRLVVESLDGVAEKISFRLYR